MSSSRLTALLGATLRRQRESRGLSQRQLAKLAQVSQAAVARIEHGSRGPSVKMLEWLLTALDVQLSVAVEPLDAHLDAQITELTRRSIAERIADTDVAEVARQLGDLPYVLTDRVVPLAEIEVADEAAADLLRRYRQQRAGGDG